MNNYLKENKDYSILIVDDNPINLEILGNMLEKLEYNVRFAKNGMMCLKSVQESIPDIILLDIHMPEMDGYEVCKKLKSDNKTKDIPVIFISALNEMFNKIQAFEIGGVDYITKPFELKEVEIRIKNQLKLKEKTLALEKALYDLKVKENILIQNEKMSALGVLTSGLAHEINNPINYISNSISALKERNEKIVNFLLSKNNEIIDNEINQIIEDIPDIFKNIYTGLNYITKIIKGLRIYSRIEKEDLIDTDIIELLESALLILNYKYKNDITIEKNYNTISKIKSFPAKLSQVFINILSNSIDAINDARNLLREKNENGKIIINVFESNEKEQNYIIIQFIDNGIGIPEENLKFIYDPFWTTKEVNKGTGLGLSICQSIMKDLEGEINIESKQFFGTKAELKIPKKI